SAVFYADKVFELGNITADSEAEALLVKGKSLLGQQRGQEAENTLMRLVNQYKTIQGAEGLYLVAQHFHEQGNYTLSNETIFDQSESFTVYDYWYGKIFLL